MRGESAALLYDYGYFLMVEMTHRTEEEVKALNRLEDSFGGLDFEDRTGFPAIARSFAPADGEAPPMYEPG